MDESAGQAATAAIRKLVIDGRYRAGDRLPPERELAEALGLSRPTVRGAIRQLVESGLLEARQGSGTYVVDVDVDAVFAVRLRLEPYAAAQAARCRSNEVAARLGVLVKELAARFEDAEAFSATDTEIHRVIGEASGNKVLCDTLDRLTDLTAVSRGITSSAEQTRRQTLRDIRTLVRAVRRGDATGATTSMEAHLEAVRSAAASGAHRDRRLTRDAAA